jgi:hypothetical protein
MALEINTDYYHLDRNQDIVLKLFNSYYRMHQHSGKILEEIPEFFLFRPDVLSSQDIATRSSDKLVIEDSIHRATERKGCVGVIKHHNPKLNYYWLELTVMPFMLGDPVTEDNQSCLFFILSHFVEYAKQNPKLYGDLASELESDKDLALMFKEINKLGEKLRPLMDIYPESQLVAFDRDWPLAEVQKLLAALKDNDQSWCEVFFETIIYMMGNKGKS